ARRRADDVGEEDGDELEHLVRRLRERGAAGRAEARPGRALRRTRRAHDRRRRAGPRGRTGGEGRRGRRSLELEAGVLPEDQPLELAQGRRGLDPELPGERTPRLLVGGEGLRLPAGAVEREHVAAPQPLPQRLAGDERLELAGEVLVPPEREVGVEPPLERVQAQLLEPRALRRRERLGRELRERRPAPQLERGPEARRGLPGAPGVEALTRLRDEPLEAVE